MSDSMPQGRYLLSIVTVTFNAVEEFAQTRDSIRSQTWQDFEWIVVDGGSADGTLQAIQQEPVVKQWRSEPDGGIYDAMNKGVKLANGDYVLFLNAGDILPSRTTFQDVIDYLSSAAAECDVLFGGASLVFPDGGKHYRPPRNSDAYIWHGLPANHQSTYYRRTVLGPNPYDLKYRICGDYYLAAKLHVMRARACYLDRSLVEFSIGGRSLYSPMTAIREPFSIQDEVLNRGLIPKLASALRRSFSILVTYLLFKTSSRVINWRLGYGKNAKKHRIA